MTMKFTPIRTLLGSFALFGALVAIPLTASAVGPEIGGQMMMHTNPSHREHMMEMMQMENWHMMEGVVQSVSTSTGSFIMNSGGEMVTVHTNASTTFAMSRTSAGLASLPVGSVVHVAGTMEGMHLTAHLVMTRNGEGAKMHMNHGMFHGNKNGWMDR